jgi:putative phosphotransacetylase
MELRRAIELAVLKTLAAMGKYYVPAAASNRHIHLGQKELDALFGKGYELKKIRDLNQPGQYVCNERVCVSGPKGRIEGLRVLGPVRKQTQVEISVTEAYKAGIPVFVRMSGDLAGTPGCRLIGPAGEVDVSNGVIIAARHLHISDEQAGWYGLKDGDTVKVIKTGERATVFENIIVRAGKDHSLEMHLDTEEANAAGLTGPEILEMVLPGTNRGITIEPVTIAASSAGIAYDLVTEWEVMTAQKEGRSSIQVKKGGIVTPLAKDTAREKGITFIIDN